MTCNSFWPVTNQANVKLKPHLITSQDTFICALNFVLKTCSPKQLFREAVAPGVFFKKGVLRNFAKFAE